MELRVRQSSVVLCAAQAAGSVLHGKGPGVFHAHMQPFAQPMAAGPRGPQQPAASSSSPKLRTAHKSRSIQGVCGTLFIILAVEGWHRLPGEDSL